MNSIARMLIQTVIYLTQNSMSLYAVCKSPISEPCMRRNFNNSKCHHHTQCCALDDSEFKQLIHSSCSWPCPDCNNVNFTNSFFEDIEIQTTNPFDPLSGNNHHSNENNYWVVTTQLIIRTHINITSSASS